MPATSIQPIPDVKRKEKHLVQALRELATKAGTGSKLPTMKELSGGFGVALATLDRAFSVLEAEGIVHRKRGSGVYVTPRIEQTSIAIVFHSFFLSKLAAAVDQTLLAVCRERAVSHRQRTLLYVDVPEAEMGVNGIPGRESLHADLRAGTIDALIVFGRTQKLQPLTVPAVTMVAGGQDPSEDLPHEIPDVVIQNYAGLIEQGVAALARQGCRRIGMLSHFGWSRGQGFQTDRLAYRRGIRAAGLPYRPQWEWSNPLDAARDQTNDEVGFVGLCRLLGEDGSHAHDRPDGLVITDDHAARGALMAARRSGLIIGRDIRIATHANAGTRILRNEEDVLTLVEFDPVEEVDALFDLIDSRLQHGSGPRRIVVNAHPRESQQPPGAAAQA